MVKYEFKNDTFEFDLTLIIFDYSKRKECDKVHKIMLEAGVDSSDAYDSINNSQGFAFGLKSFYIVIDSDCFKKGKKSTIEILTTLQHECGHIRQYVLNSISERVKTTDSETYLRISDWCFRKCLSTNFFKKLLNPIK